MTARGLKQSRGRWYAIRGMHTKRIEWLSTDKPPTISWNLGLDLELVSFPVPDPKTIRRVRR